MSDIQTSTIRVPKNVLEDIKIYCRKAGQPVGDGETLMRVSISKKVLKFNGL